MPDVKQITRPPRLRPPKNNPWPSNSPQAETGKALDLPALHQVVEGAGKVGWRKRRVGRLHRNSRHGLHVKRLL